MPRVLARLDEGLRVSISDGAHVWYADEPVDKGGGDAAPDPYGLLLGAVAACTCATLRIYADHKGLDLRAVRVSAEHERVHADDCAECAEDATGLVSRITLSVEVDGDLDGAARARLAQVARRCPVHKTLAAGVAFRDEIAFSSEAGEG